MFSIFSVIKNVTSREATFRRSIESVLGQTFGDFEYVIQDGASTDTTAQIVAEYRDPRILFLSAPDSCGEEGFYRVLKRCRGTYIGSCLSDEQLVPNALEKALGSLRENPDVAAIYGDYWIVDEKGDKSGPFISRHPFSIEAYVCQTLVPPFCASFFSREHVERAGIHDHPWRYNMGEFEFWIRMANVGRILYVPHDLSHFGRHANSSTSTAVLYDRLMSERSRAMADLFRENRILRDSNVTVNQAIAGNYVWAANSVFGIEGASERYERFVENAFAHDPSNLHLPHLIQRLEGRRSAGKPVRTAEGRCDAVKDSLPAEEGAGIAREQSLSDSTAAWDDSSDAPYLSVVAATRNDDHGGNLKLRMQLFVNCLAAQAQKHRLPTELVLVEWNPPADRPRLKDVLSFPSYHPFCSVRILDVPAAVHARYRHADALPVYQMMAKNVGIRRARGRFVLATNVDIVLSDPLFARLARQDLESGRFYRSVRHDVDNHLTAEMPLDTVLEYCRNHAIRVHHRDHSLNVRDGSKHLVYCPGATEAQLGHAKLFTNACGDFTLLSRQDWARLRGYAELDMYSFHLDSLFLFAAHHTGVKEVVFPDDMTHYHIEHGDGWTPEVHRDKSLDKRVDALGIPRLRGETLTEVVRRMGAGKIPAVSNGPQWGLADTSLPAITVTSADWESSDGRPKDVPYLSLVVTTRNDDHGGNMLQRFQSFLDHLGQMGARHKLAAELIVVEWNPAPDRPRLLDAMRWPDPAALDVRIITVPPHVHAQHGNSDKFPLFQMIAKNVGIRRARGEFVLATNIDILFSDELCAFLARRELDPECFYRIDRHDIGATSIPEELDWEPRLRFCERNIVRVHAQHGTHASEQPRPHGEPKKLHTNACGDFTLMSRRKWLEVRGYPEFHLWSIFLDGLLVHAAVAAGLRQTILRDPCRIYHIEHDLGWAKTTKPIQERPSLDYSKQYIPLCKNILTNKPLDINKAAWGLADVELEEVQPKAGASLDRRAATDKGEGSEDLFDHWIEAVGAKDNRLYYRDQSAKSLARLAEIARGHDPTVVVELGTLAGLSLRAWLNASRRARVVAVDLSFSTLAETCRILPVDLSRVTLVERDILQTDFASMWTSQDRVLLFVDAHDLPGVPIMEHVLATAVPALPDGSVVVVDDLWFSQERLTRDNARGFLEDYVCNEIDELQCFHGHYAPYHKGGSFLGFAEVIPLLEFVNRHGIELVHDRGGKHAFFVWRRAYLSQDRGPGGDLGRFDSECGCEFHNPMESVPVAGRHGETMRGIAAQYQQRDIRGAAENLSKALEQDPRDEGLSYGLAVCLARAGMLSQARDILACNLSDSSHPRYRRLFEDLARRLASPQSPAATSEPVRPSRTPSRSRVREGGARQIRPVATSGPGTQTPSQGCGLTLFAMPKAFTGHTAIIQRNAIRSWARLRPEPEIILFGDEPGIREMAAEVGAVYVPDVARNEFGTPLVDRLFGAAQDLASNAVLAYVNADMILLQDFPIGVQNVAKRLPGFLLIGQRWDLPLLDEIDFHDSQWQASLLRQLHEHAMLHAECGLDYFVFRQGLWPSIPPFAIGRTAWDNWLVMDPRKRGIPVVDGTEFITAVHQDHDYGHVAGGRHEAWNGQEAARNRALAGSVDASGLTTGASWLLRQDGTLAQTEPRCPLYATVAYRDHRSAWLLQQAQRLIAAGGKELAACKCEETLACLDGWLELRRAGCMSSESVDYADISGRYLAAHTLLAQCHMQMGCHEQAIAAYTRLLENSGVPIPTPQREQIVHLRDQLIRQLEAGTQPVRPSVDPSFLTVGSKAGPRADSSPSAIRGGDSIDPRPRVTVVIACRNAQRYLKECVDSILSQTMRDWELFLIDDGSTDGTRRMIEDYARQDARIQSHHFPDSRGPYARRNFAIRRAASDFIVIQDADDIMSPTKLERLHHEINRDDSLAIVGSHYRTFLDEFRGLEHTEPGALAVDHETIVASCVSWRAAISHGTAIIRKTLFDTIGPYDENPFAADAFWSAKLALYAQSGAPVRMANVPEYLTLIRIHPSSQTQILPVFDPRGRRVRYRHYCECKLRRIREKWRRPTPLDVAAELRNCNCSDFLVRFKAKILEWESETLPVHFINDLLSGALVSFREKAHVSCVIILNGLEVMQRDIARRVKGFDLLKGMALCASGLNERGLERLQREAENHDNPLVHGFLRDLREQGASLDVLDWCRQNAPRLELRLSGEERERVRVAMV